MKLGTLARRFLIPGWYVSIVCYMRFRAQVSPRAEVELSGNLRLGHGTIVGSFTKIKCAAGVLTTGVHTEIATGCFLDAQAGGLSIGNGVLIGANSVIVTGSYKHDRIGVALSEQGLTFKRTRIGDNTFIGSNCVVLGGSDIGSDVIVAPVSVVSGKVPPGVVVSGNPARIIFKRR